MNLNTDRVAMSAGEALDLGQAALLGIGMDSEEARTIAEHLVDNMLCGYEFAGLPRILAIAEHALFKLPRQAIRIVHETPLSATIDGGNHVGYQPVLQGALLAASKAKAQGMAVVAVSNCWFSGRNAYYLERIARQGLVAIHTASGLGNVIPPGSTKALLGTNPIGIAVPGTPDPVIFDMGTASTMWGEVLLHAMLDKDMPAGLGLDAEGQPTTSARAIAQGGGLLPFGGHKGYGLSLMVQALGILGGARRARGDVVDTGFLFIAIDPTVLMPSGEFERQLAEMIARVRALPRQPGVDAIRIPSERAFAERRRRRAEGVAVATAVRDALVAMAR